MKKILISILNIILVVSAFYILQTKVFVEMEAVNIILTLIFIVILYLMEDFIDKLLLKKIDLPKYMVETTKKEYKKNKPELLTELEKLNLDDKYILLLNGNNYEFFGQLIRKEFDEFYIKDGLNTLIEKGDKQKIDVITSFLFKADNSYYFNAMALRNMIRTSNNSEKKEFTKLSSNIDTVSILLSKLKVTNRLRQINRETREQAIKYKGYYNQHVDEFIDQNKSLNMQEIGELNKVYNLTEAISWNQDPSNSKVFKLTKKEYKELIKKIKKGPHYTDVLCELLGDRDE